MLYDKRWEKDETKVDENRKLAEWQKILLKAAALLRRHGWCQGQFQNDSGQLCASGAINVAAGLEATTRPKDAYQTVGVIEAVQHLEMTVGDQAIFQWNDHAKSQVEVIDALKKAAQDARPVQSYQDWHLWLC